MPESRFFHPMEVRYGDLDPQGHLNNAKYLTFFEQARIRYFEELGLFSKDQSFMEIGVIIADIHIKYLAPVFLGAAVKVGVQTTAIGNKSITVQQTIMDVDTGQMYADGTVVLVAYDYRKHATAPVLDEWRRKLMEFEGMESMTLPQIDTDCLIDILVRLLNTPSPTGYTGEAIELVEHELSAFPKLQLSRTRKGALLAKWQVEGSGAPRALTAHVDTLGAMVKEIKPNGRLAVTRIGGLLLNAVETEGCWVLTPRGGKVRGSLLVDSASAHVHGAKASETARTEEHMEVRLDARTSSAKETRGLGIDVGNFIAFDPRVEVTNGFIRSRFLDDKAGVAAMLAAIKALSDAGQSPTQTCYFLISNYEEVGHGAASGIPVEVQELVTVDMAAVGTGQESDEFHATLCMKDSEGPYHYDLSNKLRDLAERHAIPFKTDIYPHYGSDGEAFWRAGGDVAVALIGPGVDASHNYERTHVEALNATANWITAYLLSE